MQYFNSVHAHTPKLVLLFFNPFSIIFLALFFSFFSALLPSLPFSLHILAGFYKKLGVNYYQRHNEPFYHHFCTKTDNIFFLICYVRMLSIFKIDRCTESSVLTLPSAYYEHLVAFKLMTSKWYKEHHHKLCIYA